MRKEPSPMPPSKTIRTGLSVSYFPKVGDKEAYYMLYATTWSGEDGKALSTVMTTTIPAAMFNEPQPNPAGIDTWTLHVLRVMVIAFEDRFMERISSGYYGGPVAPPRLGLVHGH